MNELRSDNPRPNELENGELLIGALELKRGSFHAQVWQSENGSWKKLTNSTNDAISCVNSIFYAYKPDNKDMSNCTSSI
jgi:hypothetical protein